MKFHIVKSSRKGSLYPYSGPTCDKADVAPGAVYSDFKEAQADADKLSAHNDVGFVVVDSETGLPPGKPVGLYDLKQIVTAHDAWQALEKNSLEWRVAKMLYCTMLVEHVEEVLGRVCICEADSGLLWRGQTGLGVWVPENGDEGPLMNFGDSVMVEFYYEDAPNKPEWVNFNTLTVFVQGVHDGLKFATTADLKSQ